ncbi:Mu transposase C-terminal domain-containing protein [Streptomyces sp. NPDC057900]|uniref:Mu transposase C-terminal domain-containing protein n=1 Tax=Streptomyces sp. NPDC057900 TaxID=3346274 RepID=UPI0036E63F2C
MERGHHTPVRRIPADQLHHLMLASAERTIEKDGINFRSLSYVAPELHGRTRIDTEVIDNALTLLGSGVYA